MMLASALSTEPTALTFNIQPLECPRGILTETDLRWFDKNPSDISLDIHTSPRAPPYRRRPPSFTREEATQDQSNHTPVAATIGVLLRGKGEYDGKFQGALVKPPHHQCRILLLRDIIAQQGRYQVLKEVAPHTHELWEANICNERHPLPLNGSTHGRRLQASPPCSNSKRQGHNQLR